MKQMLLIVFLKMLKFVLTHLPILGTNKSMFGLMVLDLSTYIIKYFIQHISILVLGRTICILDLNKINSMGDFERIYCVYIFPKLSG